VIRGERVITGTLSADADYFNAAAQFDAAMKRDGVPEKAREIVINNLNDGSFVPSHGGKYRIVMGNGYVAAVPYEGKTGDEGKTGFRNVILGSQGRFGGSKIVIPASSPERAVQLIKALMTGDASVLKTVAPAKKTPDQKAAAKKADPTPAKPKTQVQPNAATQGQQVDTYGVGKYGPLKEIAARNEAQDEASSRAVLRGIHDPSNYAEKNESLSAANPAKTDSKISFGLAAFCTLIPFPIAGFASRPSSQKDDFMKRVDDFCDRRCRPC
jgi:hypothetical protein